MVWLSNGSVDGPLAGVKVLDLTRVLAGPFAAMILGDLGADVVKVERPGVGDETRRWGPPFATDRAGAQVGTYYYAANRNKRSVELDLDTTAGREDLAQLCEDADVLMHNYLPRVARNLGVDHQALQAKHPHLVVAGITGFGTGNEHENRSGFDFVIQAISGLMSITGPEDGDPTKVGVAISDLSAGMYATIGVLAAMEERRRTGRGPYVEISLLESQVSLLANQAMNYLIGDVVPERLGNAHPNIAPYETYHSKDGVIAIGVGTDEQFRRLAHVLEQPELSHDERFATNTQRIAHRHALNDLIEKTLQQRPAEYWIERLWDANVPCGPVNDLSEAFADPLVQDLVGHVEGVPQVRTPFKFDRERPGIRFAPPALGEHNEAMRRRVGSRTPKDTP